jgi:Domain of unknown function (DUF4139)
MQTTKLRRPAMILLCLALASCGAALDTVQLESRGQPLRLSRVVLYENGLAHFERRGRADDGTVDLRVPAAQVDDVLRSLTIVDGTEAAITGVRRLPAEEGDDVTLRVGLAGAGARDLRITYVTEVPGWRPTYRLVAQADGRVHVQGLAVVDNPTREPWEDIALTLSTEVPLSFRFDLHGATAAFRPRFDADGRLVRQDIPGDLLVETTLARGSARGGGGSLINEAYGLAQRDQPELSTRAGHMTGATTEPEIPTDDGPPPDSALLAFESRPEAEEGIFGAVDGFDLGGGESGLVPFVDTATEGRIALVYKPSTGGPLSHEHPYRAVLFQNPSDAALLTGPVAIYSGDRYVGDGVTGVIPARAHAFVPYALERSVRVAQSTEQSDDEVRATALAGGVLTVEVRAVHRDRFVLTTTTPRDEPSYVFAPALEGFEPRALPEGTVVTGQGYFLPVAFTEGRAEISLDQLRRATTTVDVSSSPDHAYVPALLSLLPADEEVARLREITDRLTVIAEERRAMDQDLAAEQRALGERRAALESLRGLGSGAAIRERLAREVARGVARVDDLTERHTTLSAEEIALRQDWYSRLRALTASR